MEKIIIRRLSNRKEINRTFSRRKRVKVEVSKENIEFNN
jgi:hypothetical protein